ncbi:MAG: KpsF/GutQ family sugar-phosphate isomerase [Saprospiraceae bacterium]
MKPNFPIPIKEIIKNTLHNEALALAELAEQVDERMTDAVQAIYQSQGRLVITGIGKSAIVAQKITSTLNSTGTASIFMHAADAIHGDLGMIGKDDIVMCISKSGDTAEIKVLTTLIKGFGNPLIGMVSNTKSYLALHADYVIYLPVKSEADPNNLAPTTSTTLQMAMGDAIAISLLSLRGFSQEEFARFHPGGSLGKQLYLRVRDMITPDNMPKVYLSDNIRKVIMEISSKRLGATVVVDDNENLLGIITDGDLRRMLESRDSVGHLSASDIMNANPKKISSDAMAVEALQQMRKYGITQLIVTDQGRYKGLVHLHDMIKEGIV